MRFHCGESMTPIVNLLPLAQAAEAHGYSGFAIPDSLIYPQQADTQYTYTEDGSRLFLENKPFLEPFVQAAAMGAVTRKLEVTTNIVKLPVRPPLHSAKLAASIAALTNNRFNLGVGLSVWPEDYKVMGVPYANRGKRFDECIAIVRGLASGKYFEFHGEFYDLPPVKINPVPSQPLPILIGGHSDAALSRAAKNDGWMYAGGAPGALAPLVEKLRAFREAAGTSDKPFRIFATEMGHITLESVQRHAELGVTDMVVAFRNLYAVEEDTQPLQDKLDDLRRFADTIIARTTP